MKKLFKPASLLFYFLMFVVFFLIGIYIAGFVGAGKNQMLAGGAIVFGWGALFAAIAFFASFFIAHFMGHRGIVRLNWLLLVLLVVLYGITHYRYIQRQKEKVEEKTKTDQQKKETTKPVGQIKLTAMLYDKSGFIENTVEIKNQTFQTSGSTMGIGFFKPDFLKYPTLYFYGGVNPEKGLLEHLPSDSVVFAKDKYNNPATIYAPPWLYPEHLKLDYGIILFKALGIGHEFVKTEANKQTKQVTYLDKNRGTIITWSEFLLSVNSVEFNANSTKKVYVKPLEHAGEVKAKFDFMQPLLVEDDWMYVKLVNEDFVEQGKGWIRWKKTDSLLVTYSLLS